MKTNYQITIGYKAVITMDVVAENEKEAKEFAIECMKTRRDKMFKKQGVDLQDDNFAVHGVLDMDKTWNMVQN
jgi:hypothetical protein